MGNYVETRTFHQIAGRGRNAFERPIFGIMIR
jgi:hypothetical protein